jgi:hypothetical protein
MSADIRQTIASGKPYPVLVPPTGGPASLELFVGDAEFTLDGGSGGPTVVRGHGVAHGDVVRFHQKDHIGGKDVRVWHISQRDGAFVAESIAAF